MGETLVNYRDVLVSQKLLFQRRAWVIFRRVKNVWRKRTWENV